MSRQQRFGCTLGPSLPGLKQDLTPYGVCGLTIKSNIHLSELPHAKGEEPECAFRLLPARAPRANSSPWFHHWRLPGGAVWLSFARRGSGYLLRFTDLADFLVSRAGTNIRCYPVPDTRLDTLRHLLLDQVIPLVLSIRKRVALHASSVVTPQGAIAFLGVTGQGKSTITGSFVKEGFPLLADDCLLAEEKEGRLFAVPSYPGLRLWPDTIAGLFGQQLVPLPVAQYTAKKRLPLNYRLPEFSPDPVPLARIYVIAPDQERGGNRNITVTPLSPRDAVMELVKHAYRLDINDRKRLGAEFHCLSRLAALVPLSRLAFPRDFSLLPAVREAILRDLDH